ncbi:MAG: ROK family protein [Candidatus Fimenecus sp.]
MLEQDTLKQIRNKNLSDILDVLRRKGACSLTQLAENTSGGLTTVTKCVQQAIGYGMIFEGETADSTGGRKPKQYVLNADYQYFLFLIVDNDALLCKICNFKFETVEETSVPFEISEYFTKIVQSIDRAVQRYAVGTVCLSLPCVLKNGVIQDWFYNSRAVGFDIRAAIAERYAVHVIVQNDMKLTVLGECAQNRKNFNNIATVQFGHNGIGVGEMLNGNVVEGASGFAGEVSYTNDLRKNIMGVAYPAKIVRNIIIYLNPEVIVFYRSPKQNQFAEIFQTAIKGLPAYAVPEYEVSDAYYERIVNGFLLLINQNAYYKKTEEENEQKQDVKG